MEHTIVYTTAFLYEVDTVRDAFTKSNIPFFVQSQNLGGVRTAFTVTPAQGFGERWHIYVPEKAVADAQKVLSTLHLTKGSDKRPFPVIDEVASKKAIGKAFVWLSPLILYFGYLFYRMMAR